MTANSGTLSSTATAALATTPTGRADLTGFQLGAQYNFSKRTTAYAIFGEQSVKGKQAASGTKIESSGYAVGLRHTF
jgi:predicted porin